VKFFSALSKKYFTIFFLRKQKFFNKGRYSRNRQLYRTGVYWCLFLNIAAVLGLNFFFYKFTINFLQYWWYFFAVIFIIIFSYFNKISMYSYYKLLYTFLYYLPLRFISKKQLININLNRLYFSSTISIYNFFYKVCYNFFE
jgi:hypothetical protein